MEALGYQIKRIIKNKDIRSLKLMENQFVKYWKHFHNSNYHPKVVELTLPILKYLVLAFQNSKLPDLPMIEFPEEDFNPDLINRCVQNVHKAKKTFDDLNEKVKKNKMEYYEKYLKELNDRDTNATHKFIQNMKINRNDVNVNTLYKNGNNHYKFTKNNNSNDNNENYNFDDAPDLLNDNNHSNNNKKSNNYIDLKFISSGDYIDYKCNDGKYRCFSVKKIDRRKKLMTLIWTKNNKYTANVDLSNEYSLRCILKPGSMTSIKPQIWFNHYYFSNKNKWSKGFILGYDNDGYVKIDTDLDKPKEILIHINDYKYINFNIDQQPQQSRSNSNSNHNHNHNHNNNHENNNNNGDFVMKNRYC